VLIESDEALWISDLQPGPGPMWLLLAGGIIDNDAESGFVITSRQLPMVLFHVIS
jgi:hypothetical protein